MKKNNLKKDGHAQDNFHYYLTKLLLTQSGKVVVHLTTLETLVLRMILITEKESFLGIIKLLESMVLQRLKTMSLRVKQMTA
jgi:hypothetical protein